VRFIRAVSHGMRGGATKTGPAAISPPCWRR
jgi:hypothetical protein